MPEKYIKLDFDSPDKKVRISVSYGKNLVLLSFIQNPGTYEQLYVGALMIAPGDARMLANTLNELAYDSEKYP